MADDTYVVETISQYQQTSVCTKQLFCADITVALVSTMLAFRIAPQVWILRGSVWLLGLDKHLSVQYEAAGAPRAY